MSDNMCEHGGLDGNCLRCKDATITRLEAENAALREEAALYQKEWAILRAEVEQLAKELEEALRKETDHEA